MMDRTEATTIVSFVVHATELYVREARSLSSSYIEAVTQVIYAGGADVTKYRQCSQARKRQSAFLNR